MDILDVQAGYAHVLVLATQVIPTLHILVPHLQVVKLVDAEQGFREHDDSKGLQIPPTEQTKGNGLALEGFLPMQIQVFCSVFPGIPAQFGNNRGAILVNTELLGKGVSGSEQFDRPVYPF